MVQLIVPQTKVGFNYIHQIPITSFNAVTLNKTKVNFNYILENSDVIKLDNRTGDIWIDSQFDKIETPATNIITAMSNNNKRMSARMSLTLIPIQVQTINDFCLKYSSNLCFWDSVLYTVAEETTISTKKIGALGPKGYPKICPNYQIKYQLVNGTEYVTIKDNDLYTKIRFDHDSFFPGPSLNIHVQCQIRKDRNEVNSLTEIVDKVVHLNILDRNDNAPRVQGKGFITINLDEPHFYKVGSLKQKNP